MKVLMLPRYDLLGASSRVRMYQYLPWLQAAGLQVTAAPFFGDGYVRGLQHNRRPLPDVARAYASRLGKALHTRRHDLLWIEKEALPWLPASLERALLLGSTPYVLDYDDAVFHYYDQHRWPLVRRLLGDKHPDLMRGAALVVAGNEYLADAARRAGATRIEIVPTVIDLERYAAAHIEHAATAPPRVGWIGQRSTAPLLVPYKHLFGRLADAGLARFTAIGIDTRAMGLPMEPVPWSEQTEAASVAQLDVGIMPLVDAPFERGKCGYKLIQYMACGLPVVASPVGVNRQIVDHGVNGFLAETEQEWEAALLTLLQDPALRRRMGQAGRRKVEQQYCIQVTGPRIAQLLVSALPT